MLNDRTDPQKETGEGQGCSSVAQQVLGMFIHLHNVCGCFCMADMSSCQTIKPKILFDPLDP